MAIQIKRIYEEPREDTGLAEENGAIHLYEKLGFTRLGTIPQGFRLNDGSYEDIHPFYISLV